MLLSNQPSIEEGRSSIERVILGVAHELNNPNTFIRVNASNIKKMLNLLLPVLQELGGENKDLKIGPYNLGEFRSKLTQMTDAILDASLRIINIADKLKQCAGVAALAKSPVEVIEVVDSIVKSHAFLIDRSAKLSYIKSSGMSGKVLANALQLEQALSILITNACDAITSTHKEPANGLLTISISNEKAHIVVEVKDNGCGMSKKVKDKIFDPFYTTKPHGVGDGIGLTLCRSIIDSLEGTIDVESTEEAGSSFIIRIPLHQETTT